MPIQREMLRCLFVLTAVMLALPAMAEDTNPHMGVDVRAYRTPAPMREYVAATGLAEPAGDTGTRDTSNGAPPIVLTGDVPVDESGEPALPETTKIAHAVVSLGRLNTPNDAVLELVDRKPIQTFEQHEDGSWAPAKHPDPLMAQLRFSLTEDGAGLEVQSKVVIVEGRTEFEGAVKGLKGVDIGKGLPVIRSCEMTWHARYELERWQGIGMPFPEDGAEGLLLVRLREQTHVPRPDNQYTLESRVIGMSAKDAGKALANLTPFSGARQYYGTARAWTAGGNFLDICSGLGEAKILTAPRVTNLLGMPEQTDAAQEGREASSKVESAHADGIPEERGGNSTHAPLARRGFRRTGIIKSTLDMFDDMGLDWFSKRSEEGNRPASGQGKPAMIADFHSKYFSVVDGKKYSEPIPVHLGMLMCVRARATETPERIEADYAYQHTWKEPGRGWRRFFKRNRIDIGRERFAYSIQCGYGQQVIFSYPYEDEMVFVVVTFSRGGSSMPRGMPPAN